MHFIVTYFKISKNRQKFKNAGQKKHKPDDDIILCQNYPIKTVGGDAFYSHYIL